MPSGDNSHDQDWVIFAPCGCPVGLSVRCPGVDTEKAVWREHRVTRSEREAGWRTELMMHQQWCDTAADRMKAGRPHNRAMVRSAWGQESGVVRGRVPRAVPGRHLSGDDMTSYTITGADLAVCPLIL